MRAEYDPKDPASLWNRQYPTEPWLVRSWERFEDAYDTCRVYTYSLQMWLSLILVLAVFWMIWLAMLIACIHHSGGRFAPATTPVSVCGFGLIILLASIMGIPQTLIFKKDSPLCTHMIGYEPIAIRREIPRQRIEGLILISNEREGSLYPALYVKWAGLGRSLLIGVYVENEVAILRAEYIASRIGLPIIRIDLRPVRRLRPGKRRLDL